MARLRLPTLEAVNTELARRDPVVFARDFLDFTPDPWQAQALRWRSRPSIGPGGRGMLLNCCRQSGKSITAAILALHQAIYYPGILALLVSPSLRQSGELFRKVTDMLATLEVKPKLTEANRLSLRLESGSRVVSLPSKEDTVRGFSGVDLIIEDEAARVPEELYRAIRPMLAVSGGSLVLMSTPFGKRGHFFEEWTQGGTAWERIEVKAPECPRIPPAFLEEERRSLRDRWYRQEYMCSFEETVDQVFAYDYVMQSITPEVRPLFGG